MVIKDKINYRKKRIIIQIIKLITSKPKLYKVNFQFHSCMPGSITIIITTLASKYH